MTAGPVGSPDRHHDLFPVYRYIPLMIVTGAVAITGIIGTALSLGGAVTNAGGTPAAPPPPPVLEIVDGTEEPTLDDVCRRPLDAPATEPWAAESAANSEEVWQSNSADWSLPYLVGEGDFVFWGDIQNNNISQAVGRRTLSADELTIWVESLRFVRDSLAAEGIDFVIVPGPGKWDVYPERMPAWARSIDGSGPLEQLLRAAPDLPIIDVRADLRAAAVDVPVYPAVNSHWSDYGSWVAWRTIAECMATIDPRFAALTVPAITGVDFIAGGNEFGEWGFEADRPDWTIPLLAEPLAPVTVAIDGQPQEIRGAEQRIGLEELPSTVTNPAAAIDETLLLLRDSMGTSLTPWLQQNFSEVRQLRHAFDLGNPDGIPDIVATAREAGATVVMLQFAQRHLNQPPDLTP